MKALLLAATSTLALTGFAVAQTAAPSATTTTQTTVTNPAAAAGDKVEDAADKAENALDKAGNKVDEAVTTGAADVAEDKADRAEDKADAAEDKADAAVTAGTATTTTTTTAAPAVTTVPATTDTAVTGATPATTTAATTTDAAAQPGAKPVVAAPDVNAPVLSASNPGLLGSWIMNRRVWSTNQPSSTTWANTTLTERPADWVNIAKVDDIVFNTDGSVAGYVADIGGFLGIGAKRVLLGRDALHLVRIGDDAFYATNFTKEELQALPDFDNTTVMR